MLDKVHKSVWSMFVSEIFRVLPIRWSYLKNVLFDRQTEKSEKYSKCSEFPLKYELMNLSKISINL